MLYYCSHSFHFYTIYIIHINNFVSTFVLHPNLASTLILMKDILSLEQIQHHATKFCWMITPVFILGLLGWELSPLKSQTHPLKLWVTLLVTAILHQFDWAYFCILEQLICKIFYPDYKLSTHYYGYNFFFFALQLKLDWETLSIVDFSVVTPIFLIPLQRRNHRINTDYTSNYKTHLVKLKILH